MVQVNDIKNKGHSRSKQSEYNEQWSVRSAQHSNGQALALSLGPDPEATREGTVTSGGTHSQILR
jgi:hypothetical protein